MGKDVSIPDILFHVTRKEYVASILEDGLIPNKNLVARFEIEDDERKGVYLTSDVETLFSMDNSFSESEYAILSVDVKDFKDKLILDDAFDGLDSIMEEEDLKDGLYDQSCWCYKAIISPSRIENFGIVKRIDSYCVEILANET